jgi:hypothetical protein
MKRKAMISVSTVITIMLLLFFYFFWGSSVPKGQQPLVGLNSSNIAELKKAFNASAKDIRVIVMLSPT